MRVVDTEETATEMFETFHARGSRRRVKFDFSWPRTMKALGETQAELYRSNKWKTNPRDFEDYKHVAESKQICYVVPGFLRDATGKKAMPAHGHELKLDRGEMPQHFTILASLIGIQVRMYGPNGRLIKGDEGLFEIGVPRGMLAGARFPDNDEPFLFVYTKLGGIHMLITGTELDIERDGIVG